LFDSCRLLFWWVLFGSLFGNPVSGYPGEVGVDVDTNPVSAETFGGDRCGP